MNTYLKKVNTHTEEGVNKYWRKMGIHILEEGVNLSRSNMRIHNTYWTKMSIHVGGMCEYILEEVGNT